jgi:hypothetical protein
MLRPGTRPLHQLTMLGTKCYWEHAPDRDRMLLGADGCRSMLALRMCVYTYMQLPGQAALWAGLVGRLLIGLCARYLSM